MKGLMIVLVRVVHSVNVRSEEILSGIQIANMSRCKRSEIMICVKEENGKSALNKEQLTIQDSAWLTEQEESEDVRQFFGILSSHQYLYRKSLGTSDALLDIVCAGQMELDRGGELALVQIDFSAAFDRVNHGGLVFKLREAGVGGMILKVFQNFLFSRTQRDNP